jgi:hypothetical protein
MLVVSSSKEVAAVEGLFLGFEMMELIPLLELLRLFKLAVSEMYGSRNSDGGFVGADRTGLLWSG